MSDSRPILLAEDSPFDAELLQAAFARSGIGGRVFRVEDGVEVLEYLRRTGRYSQREPVYPSAVILDLKMPRMDGLEALKAIRADPLLQFLPVVMLTSSREDRDLANCYRAGANAYVVKPVPYNEFLPVIKAISEFWGSANVIPPDELGARKS